MKKVSGIILAGGKSSRFGRDKCLYEYKGKPLVMHSLDIMKRVVESAQLILSTNNPDAYSGFGIRIISDIHRNCGPLGGLHSALTNSPADYIAVIPCDTPFVHPGLYDFLLKNSEGYDAVIPTHGKYAEPMCGLYRKSCLGNLDKAIMSRRLKILDALSTLQVNFADPSGEEFYTAGMFHNINRISDIPS